MDSDEDEDEDDNEDNHVEDVDDSDEEPQPNADPEGDLPEVIDVDAIDVCFFECLYVSN